MKTLIVLRTDGESVFFQSDNHFEDYFPRYGKDGSLAVVRAVDDHAGESVEFDVRVFGPGEWIGVDETHS